MIYFAIICGTKRFEANLEETEISITYVTERWNARVMIHIGAGHSNKHKRILKFFGYDIFCNNLQLKREIKQIWRYQRH